MLTKKTVLIVGAGFSSEFGFPSGIQLKNLILDNLNPDSEKWKRNRRRDNWPRIFEELNITKARHYPKI